MEIAEKKILNQLSMAMKARRLVSGEFACEKSIKTFQACLCIVAEDASDNTKKSFKNSCEFYEVPYFEFSSKELLGRAIGKEIRASVCIVDEGFANSIINKLESIQ